MDTIGSDFDTGLALYTGKCGSLALLGCDDNGGGGSVSKLRHWLKPGTNYFILAGGVGGTSGHLAFNFNFAPSEANLTFDDVSVPGRLTVPAGYGGLVWENFYFRNAFDYPGTPSGYAVGATSGKNTVVGGESNSTQHGPPPSTFSGGGLFDLVSADLTAVWMDALQVKIVAYGPLWTNQNVFTLSATAPTTIPFNYLAADKVEITPLNGLSLHPGYNPPEGSTLEFVVDNLVLRPREEALPRISIQPASVTNLTGSPTGFKVQAGSLTPIEYQWQRNGANLSDGPDLTGTRSATLRFRKTSAQDVGAYRVIVRNGAGSVTSDEAKLVGFFYSMTTVASMKAPQEFPEAGLALADDGNFYGTTHGGGIDGNGSIFRLHPDGKLDHLLSFNGANGSHPQTTLVRGLNGKLYGTTLNGGAATDHGTVFEISTNGDFRTIFSFNGKNGSLPNGLAPSREGVIYGTTQYGGPGYTTFPSGTGVFFTLQSGVVNIPTGSPRGLYSVGPLTASKTLSFLMYGVGYDDETVPKVFSIDPFGHDAPVASVPKSMGFAPRGLTWGKDGAIYGTAYSGGDNNSGSVFKVPIGGLPSAVASFRLDGPEGYSPWSALTLGADGRFYGGTTFGGTGGGGAVFQLTPEGEFTVIVPFSGPNGSSPRGVLLQTEDSSFYGTTAQGGENNAGTIFKLTPVRESASPRATGSAPTGAGQNVAVTPIPGVGPDAPPPVQVSFANVTAAGATTLNVLDPADIPALPKRFAILPVEPGSGAAYFELETTAEFTGKVQLCFHYDDARLSPAGERSLVLLHYSEQFGGWLDITSGRNTASNQICGETESLSPFALALCEDCAPQITTHPQDREVVAGADFTLAVVATGSEPLSYQWTHAGTNLVDGGNIRGSSNAQLTITNATGANEGDYLVVVANAFGSATSRAATVTLIPSPELVVNGGFETGVNPPTDWYRSLYVGSAEIEGWTVLSGRIDWSGSLSLPKEGNLAAQLVDDGTSIGQIVPAIPGQGYRLVFSLMNNVFLAAPTTVEVRFGSTAQSVTIPAGPQWSWHEYELVFFADSTAPTVAFTSVDGGHVGPSVDSVSLQALTSSLPPKITLEPADRRVVEGGAFTLTVEASGTPPLAYQWQHAGTNLVDGANASGTATSTLTVARTAVDYAGNYQAIVANAFGSTTSRAAKVTVVVPTIVQNGSFEETSLTGGSHYAYTSERFEGGWVVESSDTHLDLYDNITSAGLWHSTPAGTQFTYLADGVGATTLRQDLETPLEAGGSYELSFLQSGFAFPRGFPGKVTFTISPLDSPEQVFRQTFTVADGADWTRQSARFAVPSTGRYSLRAVSTPGKIANVDDIAIVGVPGVIPTVSLQPRSQTVRPGQSFVLTVAASGTEPLTYRWERNGSALADGGNVAGGTTSELKIGNAGAINAGTYRAIVENAFGSATSLVATVTITNPAPNLLVNGSFESPVAEPNSVVGQPILPGWQGVRTSPWCLANGDIGAGNPRADDGTQYICLGDAPDYIYQVFSVSHAGIYALTWADNTSFPPGPNHSEYFASIIRSTGGIAGQGDFDAGHTEGHLTEWGHKRLEMPLEPGEYTVYFTANQAPSGWATELDNVVLAPTFDITATPPVIRLSAPSLAGETATLPFELVAGSAEVFRLLQSGEATGPWTQNLDAVLTAKGDGKSYQFSAPASGPAMFYRIQAP